MADPFLHDVSRLTAVELRDALASGALSAREVTGHFLSVIEERNKQLGAFVTVTAEQALRDAGAADRLHAQLSREGRREEIPVLHGMPIAFKDLTDVAGVPTTHGSAALEHKPAPEDGVLAATLKGQGVISLGKTQVPEFGLTAYSENRVAPPSRNPHAMGRSSGGSSGGSAAAVAAGLIPFAPGTDGGGSIRIPAGACGLVGLKPGRGLVPSGASAGDAAQLVVAGPLARTAADAALLMDALVPRHEAPDGGYLANVGRAPEPLRIGVSLDSPWAGIYPFHIDEEAIAALELGTKLLEKAGHSVGQAGIRYDNRYPEAFTTAWTAGVGSARIAPQREALLTPLTRTFRRRAQQRSASKVNEALSFLRQFQHDTVAQYAEWDLILMPTLAQTPRPIGWFTGGGHSGEPWPSEWAGDADEDYKRQCQYAPWSSMVNVCGLPAISIPVHTAPGGLPMGIQLIGRPGSELLLLQLAAVLEAR
ncbi:amidase [Paenarthrobacter aurescens]|uniref:Amidase n=1 Tax=Paenarthrobacter aurescens TaxID=43663 RepID=A0A4Y3NHK8_PAEAU|nr:amidase [Paenarthrobacter aurescens]MDO6141799.1 amidase [Paenarthrobacter aurescens]MDO6149562.1 amidase [Paenarthrobacter aurescens]MDO6156848.1 amidase [Paenarthrobacter aurescens]MDO6160834.1 amidase [Paenarthrobacter aurescens]GEB18548.1 amidase [Paenarthrobacter aurescens]